MLKLPSGRLVNSGKFNIFTCGGRIIICIIFSEIWKLFQLFGSYLVDSVHVGEDIRSVVTMFVTDGTICRTRILVWVVISHMSVDVALISEGSATVFARIFNCTFFGSCGKSLWMRPILINICAFHWQWCRVLRWCRYPLIRFCKKSVCQKSYIYIYIFFEY